MNGFTKLVLAVLVALGIYHFLFSKPAQPPAQQESVQISQHLSAQDFDQLFYQGCVNGLKSSVVQEQGYTSIDIGEWILCKDLVTDVTMKDLKAKTTLVYTRPFSVVTPDGVLVKAALISSDTSKVVNDDGDISYETEETYGIHNLTGFRHIAIGECNSDRMGSEGYLTIFSCD